MKCVEVDSCEQCPWLKWDGKPCCGHPETLDRRMKNTMSIPRWCMLDELVDAEE